jgi:hypothetical protein
LHSNLYQHVSGRLPTEKIISNSYAGGEIAHPIEKQPSFAIDSSLNRATTWHSAARLASCCIERPEERTKHAHDGHILQPEPADENFIGVARAVRHSSYSEQYLHRLVRKQIIRAVKFGHFWMVDLHSLQAYLDQAANKNQQDKRYGPRESDD